MPSEPAAAVLRENSWLGLCARLSPERVAQVWLATAYEPGLRRTTSLQVLVGVHATIWLLEACNLNPNIIKSADRTP